jgi:mycothiol synthase
MEAGLAAAGAAGPDGVVFRALRDDADFEAMAAIRRATAAADHEEVTADAEELAQRLRIEGVDAHDVVLVAEVDGTLIGWAYGVDRGESTDVDHVLVHTGHVHPDHRRRGIGRALLAGAQALLRAGLTDAAGASDQGTQFESHIATSAVGTMALLEGDGYRAARWAFGMLRPNLDEIPEAELPPGIEVRPTTRATALQVQHAFDEAMLDHPGWTQLDDEHLLEAQDHPLFGQMDVWQVAWEGDEVVGGVLGWIDEGLNEELGIRRGFTEGIFTRRPWRGRGVAGALIVRNLRLLAERGMTEASLSVDVDNPSGALRLYEKFGFREHHREALMRKPVQTA